jgi:SAM-dependent methyltransferase
MWRPDQGLLPPRRLRLALGGDIFRELGERTVRNATELADLGPGDRVLDIGCGPGRVALALSGRLEGGSYEGFDPDAAGIRWCRRQITPRFPSFRFRHVDLANAEYNRRGGERAAAFVFPYEDASFDLVIAASVYTHLTPPEVANYLRETARVLAPGGRCLASFFLVNEESLRQMESGETELWLEPREEDGLYGLAGLPDEVLVGLAEQKVRSMHDTAGLAIREPIQTGSWSSRNPFAFDHQDVVVSERR